MKLDNFREISGDQIESNIECFFFVFYDLW